MSKMLFENLLIPKDGLIKGPFGGDIKKSLFVPKSDDAYKVYEQGVVLKKDIDYGNYYISKEHFESKLRRFEVKRGDILMTGAGTLGELLTVPNNAPKGVINQALLRIRLNESVITSSFFKYYFKYYIKAIISRINGDSVIPNLPPLPLIKNTEVDIPSLSNQNKIAKVLSDLDAKIELNNKINDNLEQMAKALYDYWFVQFNFPDTDGKPYKTSGGKMVWNEELKREIPVGWGVVDLSDIANITMGQSPPGESYNEEGVGTVFYQGCTDFGNRFPTIRKFTTSPSRFARQGDILLSVRAPVGTMNIAKEDCCIGRGLASLNSKDNCISYLFGVIVNLKQIFDRRNVDGTTFGSITKDDLFSLKVIKPSKIVLEKFNSIVNPCFEKQNKLSEENQELVSLRDWLLPMLMNGQVKVGNITINDLEKDEVLAMVAEPVKEIVSKRKKETKVVSIKANPVEIYKRTLLAAEIVYQLHNEATLGHLKLQKLLYLCQEVNNMSLPMNFLKQAMGPYDNRLMRSLDKQFEEKRWFKFEKTEFLKYKPLGAVGSHQNDYLKYFEEDKPKIDYLIATFRKYKSHDIEAVATLYACWKEAIVNKELVNLELILKKFYAWSEEKEKFKPEELKSHLTWMKNNGICPK